MLQITGRATATEMKNNSVVVDGFVAKREKPIEFASETELCAAKDWPCNGDGGEK